MFKATSQKWPEENPPVLHQPNTKWKELDSTQPLLLPPAMLLLHQELKFIALNGMPFETKCLGNDLCWHIR